MYGQGIDLSDDFWIIAGEHFGVCFEDYESLLSAAQFYPIENLAQGSLTVGGEAVLLGLSVGHLEVVYLPGPEAGSCEPQIWLSNEGEEWLAEQVTRERLAERRAVSGHRWSSSAVQPRLAAGASESLLADLLPDWISQYAVARLRSHDIAQGVAPFLESLEGLLRLDLPRFDPLGERILRLAHPDCWAGDVLKHVCEVDCPVDCLIEPSNGHCPCSCEAMQEGLADARLAQVLTDQWLHANALAWADLRDVVADLPAADVAWHELRSLLQPLTESERGAVARLTRDARECDVCEYNLPGWSFESDEAVTCDACIYDIGIELYDCVPAARSLMLPEIEAAELCQVLTVLAEVCDQRRDAVPQSICWPLEDLGATVMRWPLSAHPD